MHIGSDVHALRCVADAGTDRDRHVICGMKNNVSFGENSVVMVRNVRCPPAKRMVVLKKVARLKYCDAARCAKPMNSSTENYDMLN